MFAAVAATQSSAQAGEPVSVSDRFNELHRPKGLVIEGVEVRPSLSMDAGYDGNIPQSAGGESSPTVGLRGSVDARLRSGIYTFDANVGAGRRWYPNAASFGALDLSLRASAAAELSNLTLRLSAGLEEDVETPRTNGLIVNGAFESYAELPRLRRVPLGLDARYGLGPFVLEGAAQATAIDAETLRTKSGVAIVQTFRSGWETALRLRGTYVVYPGFDLFLEGTENLQRFEAAEAGSDTWRAVVGGHFEITRLLVAEWSAGTAQQSFPNGATASGFVYGARFRWFAHELLTLSFEANRGFGAETEQAAGLTFATPATLDEFKIRAEFEPLRTLMVFAQGSYERSDGVRDETFTTLGAGASYYATPNLRLDAELQYFIASSNFAGDFTRTQFNLGITAAY